MKLKKTRIHNVPQRVLRRRHRALVATGLIVLTLVVFSTIGLYWVKTQAEIDQRSRDQAAAAALADQKIAEAEARKKQPVFISLPGAEPFEALVGDYNQPDSLWALVNKERSATTTYVPADLVRPEVEIRPNATPDEQKVRKEVAGAVYELFSAARKQGYSLMIGSAYRSAATQEVLFNRYVATSGLAQAQMYSARPGHSEHQLGLAVDISTASQNCYLSECFLGTPEGTWLANNAYMYGFTLRYKQGKEAITGYNFEPWHYRYVGVAYATALHQSGLTLEEAWPYLETAQATLKKNGAL